MIDMITFGAVTTKKQDGDHILIVPKKDMQEIANVFTIFCEDHPRKKNAAKISDQFNSLEIW